MPDSVTIFYDTEGTLTVTAENDTADDDGESVTLAFGEPLPRGVTTSNPTMTIVNLTDNDVVSGAPSILTVEITSESRPDGFYTIGDEIEVTVGFNKTVTVSGSPQIGLTVGNVTRQATYRDSAGEVVRFVYTIANGDNDDNGVSISADSLSLNGDMIRDGSDNDANRDHGALGNNSRHKVEGTRPELAAMSGAVVNGATLTLTYTEPLDSSSRPPSSAFSVSGGASSRTVSGVTVSGNTVQLTLSSTVAHWETGIRVNYTVPTGMGGVDPLSWTLPK